MRGKIKGVEDIMRNNVQGREHNEGSPPPPPPLVCRTCKQRGQRILWGVMCKQGTKNTMKGEYEKWIENKVLGGTRQKEGDTERWKDSLRGWSQMRVLNQDEGGCTEFRMLRRWQFKEGRATTWGGGADWEGEATENVRKRSERILEPHPQGHTPWKHHY